MTEPQPLPGLEPEQSPEGPLVGAVRRTLAELNRRGYIDEASAARCALALELARIIADKRRTGRTSTVGNDARVLVELLDDLLPADLSQDAALQKAMQEWTEALGGPV